MKAPKIKIRKQQKKSNSNKSFVRKNSYVVKQITQRVIVGKNIGTTGYGWKLVSGILSMAIETKNIGTRTSPSSLEKEAESSSSSLSFTHETNAYLTADFVRESSYTTMIEIDMSLTYDFAPGPKLMRKRRRPPNILVKSRLYKEKAENGFSTSSRRFGGGTFYDYLFEVAQTGKSPTTWEEVQAAFCDFFKDAIYDIEESFRSTTRAESCLIEGSEGMRIFNFVLEKMKNFKNFPFTFRRLCELLTYPTRWYTDFPKFMRALEKVMDVEATTEPSKPVAQDANDGQKIVSLFFKATRKQKIIAESSDEESGSGNKENKSHGSDSSGAQDNDKHLDDCMCEDCIVHRYNMCRKPPPPPPKRQSAGADPNIDSSSVTNGKRKTRSKKRAPKKKKARAQRRFDFSQAPFDTYDEIIELPDGVYPQDVQGVYECISDEEANREIVRGALMTVYDVEEFDGLDYIQQVSYYQQLPDVALIEEEHSYARPTVYALPNTSVGDQCGGLNEKYCKWSKIAQCHRFAVSAACSITGDSTTFFLL
ncbi:unnamed protein product [Cylicocyclus nassatus]|uniref:Uncharacterized protein n=1 Tax=Cylicocyclus nassatus TaxID=53992 RepID=A0AA36MIG5_CYLNA|nr:unnamed protein product [Cylicocyclus nassatus]